LYICTLLDKQTRQNVTNQFNKDKKIRLSELKKGDEAYIESFDREEYGLVRLGDMGLNKGVAFRVIRFAPTGDPIEIKTRGFYLSIRKSQAKQIWVKK
jgi:ferrous iron transport protein A